jgi:hypothetical protein
MINPLNAADGFFHRAEIEGAIADYFLARFHALIVPRRALAEPFLGAGGKSEKRPTAGRFGLKRKMRRGTAEGALNTVEFLSWGDFMRGAGRRF